MNILIHQVLKLRHNSIEKYFAFVAACLADEAVMSVLGSDSQHSGASAKKRRVQVNDSAFIDDDAKDSSSFDGSAESGKNESKQSGDGQDNDDDNIEALLEDDDIVANGESPGSDDPPGAEDLEELEQQQHDSTTMSGAFALEENDLRDDLAGEDNEALLLKQRLERLAGAVLAARLDSTGTPEAQKANWSVVCQLSSSDNAIAQQNQYQMYAICDLCEQRLQLCAKTQFEHDNVSAADDLVVSAKLICSKKGISGLVRHRLQAKSCTLLSGDSNEKRNLKSGSNGAHLRPSRNTNVDLDSEELRLAAWTAFGAPLSI